MELRGGGDALCCFFFMGTEAEAGICVTRWGWGVGLAWLCFACPCTQGGSTFIRIWSMILLCHDFASILWWNLACCYKPTKNEPGCWGRERRRGSKTVGSQDGGL